MSEYDNSGLISKNERKEKPNHPDQSGSCTIDGKDYWISGWVKQGSKGKFLSLAFKPKEGGKRTRSKPEGSKFDDDIPF